VRWHACTKRAAIGSPPPSTPGPSRPAHLLQGRDFLARALGLLCRTLLVNLQQLQVALQPRDARSQLLLRRHQLPRRRQRAQLLLRRRLLLQQRKQRGGGSRGVRQGVLQQHPTHLQVKHSCAAHNSAWQHTAAQRQQFNARQTPAQPQHAPASFRPRLPGPTAPPAPPARCACRR
jgi:hypothetical protein